MSLANFCMTPMIRVCKTTTLFCERSWVCKTIKYFSTSPREPSIPEDVVVVESNPNQKTFENQQEPIVSRNSASNVTIRKTSENDDVFGSTLNVFTML